MQHACQQHCDFAKTFRASVGHNAMAFPIDFAHCPSCGAYLERLHCLPRSQEVSIRNRERISFLTKDPGLDVSIYQDRPLQRLLGTTAEDVRSVLAKYTTIPAALGGTNASNESVSPARCRNKQLMYRASRLSPSSATRRPLSQSAIPGPGLSGVNTLEDKNQRHRGFPFQALWIPTVNTPWPGLSLYNRDNPGPTR